jgi:type IV secretory pathway VirB2 component (pilin)
MIRSLPRWPTTAVVAFSILDVIRSPAAGSNMPWEQLLNQILQSVKGRSRKSLR